jgi:hypothetical protein
MTLIHDLSRETTQAGADVIDGEIKPNDEKRPHTPVAGFLFFGIVGLLCFNFFLSVLVYFKITFGQSFVFYSSIIYGLSNNCGQLLIIFFGPRFTFAKRIYYSAISLGIILLLFPLVAALVTRQTTGFALGLVLTFGLGFFNAVIQSAGFGLAGICSAKSMEFFSVGQSLSGLLPWPLVMLLKVIYEACSLSTESDTPGRLSAVGMACTVTALVIAAVATFMFAPYYKYILSKKPMVQQALLNLETMKQSELVEHRPKVKIIKDTLPLAMSVWFVLFVTFLVFPGQILGWSSSFGINAEIYPGLMMYVYQVFDVVGRYMVSIWRLSPLQTKIGCVGRLSLIPLFFLATYSISFFSNDITRMVVMAVFAAANGFLLTWCMIHGPGQVHKDEADVASYTMSFFLVNGIFFGSLVAMGIDAAMKA